MDVHLAFIYGQGPKLMTKTDILLLSMLFPVSGWLVL